MSSADADSMYAQANGLLPGEQYLVVLHFAELDFPTNGSRVFSVLLNGHTVLSDFDIIAAAGARQPACSPATRPLNCRVSLAKSKQLPAVCCPGAVQPPVRHATSMARATCAARKRG